MWQKQRSINQQMEAEKLRNLIMKVSFVLCSVLSSPLQWMPTEAGGITLLSFFFWFLFHTQTSSCCMRLKGNHRNTETKAGKGEKITDKNHIFSTQRKWEPDADHMWYNRGKISFWKRRKESAVTAAFMVQFTVALCLISESSRLVLLQLSSNRKMWSL